MVNGTMKRLAAGAVAATVLLGSGSWPAVPFTDGFSITALAQETESRETSGGEDIVNIGFEDGETDGFTIYTNGGECEIANTDGALDVAISSCGSLDYANQVYWDGFALDQNCVYTYSFDIACDMERQVEYRLQLNGGDYHAYVGEWLDVGPEYLHFSVDWTMTEASDPAPRIVFNMGKTEDMTEDPGPHHVFIDNIRLTVKDDSNAVHTEALPEYANDVLNQVGYRPDDSKTVVVKEDSEEGAFYIVDEATGENVFEGAFEKAMYDEATKTRVKRGDFSSFKEEGEYHIHVESGDLKEDSAPFRIGEGVYDQVFYDAVRMLCLQRCGCELTAEYAGEFAHPVCHDSAALIYGTDQVKDVSGGWHDAGDYGRYVVAGAKAVMDLMLAFEDCGLDADDIGIPESGNGIPDILDEAMYELAWMLKMQDPETGGVYHKVTCRSFPGEVMPQDETDELVLAPVSAAATGDFSAVMAKASVIFRPFDEEFADKALEASAAAWEYVKDLEDDKGFTNPEEIVTGEYPDRSSLDEIIWAAVELYCAGYTDVRAALLEKFNPYISPGLGWSQMISYAYWDLWKAGREDAADDEMAKLCESCGDIFAKAAADLMQKSSKDAYSMTLGKVYPWGSNMSVANNAMLLMMASQITGEDPCRELAKRHLDYLLGANGLGMCFVTGEGTRSPVNPHHRPSQALGSVMRGMLVGGPDSSLEDPYAKGVLADQAPAMCYVDNAQSFSTNEVTIYWNSPLIYLLSAFR